MKEYYYINPTEIRLAKSDLRNRLANLTVNGLYAILLVERT